MLIVGFFITVLILITDLEKASALPLKNLSRIVYQDSCTDDIMEIRTLTIEDGQNKDAVIYRLEKGWILEFHLGSSLWNRQVKIFTNYPIDGTEFNRTAFQLLNWSNPCADAKSLTAQIKLNRAGPYKYYFTYDDNDEIRSSGYFLVDPSLCTDTYPLKLDEVQCITYISTSLGPFSNWEKKVQVAAESGYNVIHFTAMQAIGSSLSAYSIADHMKVNPVFYDEQHSVVSWDDIAKKISEFRKKFKIVSIADVVLNHASPDAQWIKEHPESAYNMVSSPYLKPGYLLDVILFQFSMEVSRGEWESKGIPRVVENEQHLEAIRRALSDTLIPNAKFEEFYIVSVDSLVREFLNKCKTLPPPDNTPRSTPDLKVIQDPQYRRLKSTVDMDLAIKRYNIQRNDCSDENSRLQKNADDFKHRLQFLNWELKNMLKEHLNTAIFNLMQHVKYFRVQPDGPRMKDINEWSPLFNRYFIDYNNEPLEKHMETNNGKYIMAHNGWMFDGQDSIRNFAAPGTQTFLRRDYIPWSDTVKLRFGDSPADSPFLWDYIRKYVEITVQTFDGIRLDNCHGTPIHVAEYMLDAARQIKPDIYTIAELFTLSEESDNIHINRIGINSLIRINLWAPNAYDLAYRIGKYSGQPDIINTSGALQPSSAHTLFFDLTHDDGNPMEQRTIFDFLPSSALVAMTRCASGSTWGYDELVPEHISVVGERRLYMDWSPDQITEKTGIVAGKKAINDLHYFLGINGYSRIKIHQIDSDIIGVIRQNDTTHESVILFAYTVFKDPNPSASGEGKSLTVDGLVEHIIIETYLEHKGGNRYDHYSNYRRNDRIINGLTEYNLNLKLNISPDNAAMARFTKINDKSTRIELTRDFKPGCVIAIKLKGT